ncbi:hypothetical protein ELI03_04955 [Rhizobium leguminosarum]|uniref:Uncharacterized protein n=1 Tax=Rhizobium leguminosarum TaxID=384 RepID=A0A4Q8Y0B7_RHILE|nr:hypothetical protein ELI03_04955 [Rhizobium leguminosarum]
MLVAQAKSNMNGVPRGPLIRPFGPPSPRWGEEGASPNAQRTYLIQPPQSRRDRQRRPGSSTCP